MDVLLLLALATTALVGTLVAVWVVPALVDRRACRNRRRRRLSALEPRAGAPVSPGSLLQPGGVQLQEQVVGLVAEERPGRLLGVRAGVLGLLVVTLDLAAREHAQNA